MDTLSSAGGGLEHLSLFQACCIWLEYYCILQLDKLIKLNKNEKTATVNLFSDPSFSSSSSTTVSIENPVYLIESACYLLTCVASI